METEVVLRRMTTSLTWVWLPVLLSNSMISLENLRSAVSTLSIPHQPVIQWASMSPNREALVTPPSLLMPLETLPSTLLLLSLKLATAQPHGRLRPTTEITSTEVSFSTVSNHPPTAGVTATEVDLRKTMTSQTWVLLPALQSNSGASPENLRSAASTLSIPHQLVTQWASTLFNREASTETSIITNTTTSIIKDT